MVATVEILVFVLSLAVLAKASHYVIKSSMELEKLLGIGEFAIGFIFLAIATSLPELAVSIMAGLKGSGAIVYGNVIGSNIANNLLIIGTAAFFQGIIVTQKDFSKHAAILFAISLIPLVLLQRGVIGFLEGVVLVTVFLAYCLVVSRTKINLGLKKRLSRRKKPLKIMLMTLMEHTKTLKSLVVLGISIAFVLAASHFMVNSAVNIASTFSIKESIIAMTIIALGTSMPELAIAIKAISEKRSNLAIGEALGSSVMNLTLVLGTGAILTPIPINFDVVGSATIFMVVIGIVLWYSISANKRISKKEGALFLAAYVLFLVSELGFQFW